MDSSRLRSSAATSRPARFRFGTTRSRNPDQSGKFQLSWRVVAVKRTQSSGAELHVARTRRWVGSKLTKNPHRAPRAVEVSGNTLYPIRHKFWRSASFALQKNKRKASQSSNSMRFQYLQYKSPKGIDHSNSLGLAKQVKVDRKGFIIICDLSFTR